MTPQPSRHGQTKVKAFTFYAEDEKNLVSIMRLTDNWNKSEAVRAALAHYEEHLKGS